MEVLTEGKNVRLLSKLGGIENSFFIKAKMLNKVFKESIVRKVSSLIKHITYQIMCLKVR